MLISPLTARGLQLRWKFFAGKDISATLAIANGVVYFSLAKRLLAYTIPDEDSKRGGYSGASQCGSSPATDPRRRLLYVANNNLYTVSPWVAQCQEKQNNQTKKPSQPALRARQMGGYDAFYFACLAHNNPDCPPGPNEWGGLPMLLSISTNGNRRDTIAAMLKSGFARALDRDTRHIVWFKVRTHCHSWETLILLHAAHSCITM
ncbi:hypothetical protein EUGRSUZ_G02528 [Eucalyptus grandis]|uniref:Uncharacterized protein n=2 Tax=Eucalyptus grandis TaxID=71139 RepID=A0ACC3K7F9_EUCGR|nr:hypothetical protein EUGRSUZ_G02528 [Eucalyptus grandis]